MASPTTCWHSRSVISTPGWNTPVFNNISSTKFRIWSCRSSASSLYYDWMHHWPALPSTGTREVRYTCENTTSKWAYTWTASGTADYSVEYTHRNSATISNSWDATY